LTIDTFKDEPHVEVHSLLAAPFGPFREHGVMEILFTKDVFTRFVSWLVYNSVE
jgi:hypothetical protein